MYGNAMKDRLYCERPDAPLRRRCQTVMYNMVNVLTRLLAPMLVFTADEAWEHIQHKPAGEEGLASVHLASLPKPTGREIGDEVRAEWKLLFDLREKALLQLDALKKSGGMNKALDAEVVYEIADAGLLKRLQEYGVDLEDVVGCGYHSLVAGGETKVTAVDRREKYQACARSWKRRPDVGSAVEHPDLCARDAEAIGARERKGVGSHY
jgi:isoleucyl-tRNA synthetase